MKDNADHDQSNRNQQAGADVNRTDDVGNTPLIWAVFRGYHELIELFLKRPELKPNIANLWVIKNQSSTNPNLQSTMPQYAQPK